MGTISYLLHLDRKYLDKFIFRNLRSRNTHVYCTGTPKSGTHSIAHIFDRSLLNAHEPDRDELVDIYFKKRSNNISKQELREIVSEREKRLHLEMNSSCYNYIIIEELLEIYPNSKFIHPVRTARNWLDSWINHEINHQNCEFHDSLRPYFDTVFKKDKIPYSEEEKVLERMNLPTIEGMLSYWKEHNLKVLQTVPEDRLFVLRTKDISNKIESIIEFTGIDNILQKKRNSHAYKADEKHDILSSIDSKYLNRMIDKYSIELNKWL